MEKMLISCLECNTPVPSMEDLCSNCGSIYKNVVIGVEDKFHIRTQVKGKITDTTKPKKKKLIRDFRLGSEQSHNGEWVYKERLIDTYSNTYYEEVRKEDGTLIHHCSEKLTEHQGHGNAKFKTKNNEEI